MELNEIQKISNLKLFESSESQCYIHNDIIYKVFNENIDIESRLDVINTFLENDISGCPKLYNFIYSDNKIVGYVMKYYKKAVPFSQNEKFEFIRKKCIELIDIYLMIKNEYNLCYFDFHYGNIFINDGKILLFDIDSCLKKTYENEQVSNQLLSDFILGMIYKICFFDYEIYFDFEERKQIRNILYTTINGERIETIEDLKRFIINVSKNETKRILKKTI